MVLTSVHSIVNSALASMGLPIHYYVGCLHYALKCVRTDIGFDTNGVVNKKAISQTVTNGETTIPDDCIDIIRVGVKVGKHIIELTQVDHLNRIEGDYASLGVAEDHDVDYPEFINTHGEHEGRNFGWSGGTRTDVYQVIQERGVLIFDPAFMTKDTEIYIEYLSSGEGSVDTFIHPYAEPTVEAYVEMQMKKQFQKRLEFQNAERDYYRQLRKTRARLSGITKKQILRALRKGHKQSIKS